MKISQREEEILVLVGRGLAAKEIAAALHISSYTVQTHLKNVYRKLGVGNRVEALNRLGALKQTNPTFVNTTVEGTCTKTR